MTRIKQLWNKLKPKTKSEESALWAILFTVILLATGIKALITDDVVDWILVAIVATASCTRWLQSSIQRHLEVYLELEEQKVMIYEQDRLRQDASHNITLAVLAKVTELEGKLDDGNTAIQVRLSHLEKLAEKDGS